MIRKVEKFAMIRMKSRSLLSNFANVFNLSYIYAALNQDLIRKDVSGMHIRDIMVHYRLI